MNKYAFILDLEIPPQQVLVSIGMNHKEVVKYISKKTKDESKIQIIRDEKEIYDDLTYGKVHGFVAQDETNGALILGVREFDDNWDYWDILNHEVSHLVDIMLTQKGAGLETEFRAYSHEYIFRKIRQELYRKFPVKEILESPTMPLIASLDVLNLDKV